MHRLRVSFVGPMSTRQSRRSGCPVWRWAAILDCKIQRLRVTLINKLPGMERRNVQGRNGHSAARAGLSHERVDFIQKHASSLLRSIQVDKVCSAGNYDDT